MRVLWNATHHGPGCTTRVHGVVATQWYGGSDTSRKTVNKFVWRGCSHQWLSRDVFTSLCPWNHPDWSGRILNWGHREQCKCRCDLLDMWPNHLRRGIERTGALTNQATFSVPLAQFIGMASGQQIAVKGIHHLEVVPNSVLIKNLKPTYNSYDDPFDLKIAEFLLANSSKYGIRSIMTLFAFDSHWNGGQTMIWQKYITGSRNHQV